MNGDELAKLDGVLRGLGPGALGVDGVDGLVTAIVVGPDMVMPSQWMPRVWDGHESRFRDGEQARWVVDRLMAMYGRVASSLADGAAGFEPLFRRPGAGPDARRDWCAGFMAGVARHPTWVEPAHRAATLELLVPFAMLAAGGSAAANPDLVERIGPSVGQLQAHWSAAREARAEGLDPGDDPRAGPDAT